MRASMTFMSERQEGSQTRQRKKMLVAPMGPVTSSRFPLTSLSSSFTTSVGRGYLPETEAHASFGSFASFFDEEKNRILMAEPTKR